MNNKRAIQLARQKYKADGDDMQIDDDAICAMTDSGVWVQAWVFVEDDNHPINMPRPGKMFTSDE